TTLPRNRHAAATFADLPPGSLLQVGKDALYRRKARGRQLHNASDRNVDLGLGFEKADRRSYAGANGYHNPRDSDLASPSSRMQRTSAAKSNHHITPRIASTLDRDDTYCPFHILGRKSVYTVRRLLKIDLQRAC